MARLLKDATPSVREYPQSSADFYGDEYATSYEEFVPRNTGDINPNSYEYLQQTAENASRRSKR